MSEHLTPEQQNLLLQRALAKQPLMRCLEHLDGCAQCREQLSQKRGQPMVLTDQAAELPAHLEYEQLSAYILGTLDEVSREIADNHLAACEFCAGEIQALFTLQTELHEILPPAHQATTVPPLSWRDKFQQRWLPRWQPWPRLAFALASAALFVLVSLSGLWWLNNRHLTGSTETAQLQASPALPSSSVSPVSSAPTPAPPIATDLLALVDHGQTFSLRQDGSLQSPLALPERYAAALKTTLTKQQLNFPTELNELAPPANTLKGAPTETKSFQVLAPLGQVLQSARPVFRWQAFPDTTHYEVAVFDEEFNQVLTSGPIKQTTWQANQLLPRGRVYLWQVTAQVGDQQITAPLAPAPEARFQILSQAKAQELQQARQVYGPSHLLLGVLYAQAGLLEDSEREWRALQLENPQDPLVRQMLRQVRQARERNQNKP